MNSNTLSRAQLRYLRNWEGMLPGLKPMARELIAMEGVAAKEMLLQHYDFGSVLRKVMSDRQQYGRDAIKQLSLYFGLTADELHRLSKLPDTFTREQIVALAECRQSKGGRISLAHLLSLADVKDRTDREALIDRTFDDSLTPRQLDKAIRSLEVQRSTREESTRTRVRATRGGR